MSGHYAVDLTGMILGYYKVISRAENQIYTDKNGRLHQIAMWLCECQLCGQRKVVRGDHLKSGRTISCGCYRKAKTKEALTKHGGCKTKLYGIWNNIKNRCNNPRVSCYERYGGRGIKMCEEWEHDFAAFQEWCYANGYDENADFMQCQIDRIDNDGPYAPWNCRFVTAKENANNRRAPKLRLPELISVYNLQLTRHEWHKLLNIGYQKLKVMPDQLEIPLGIYLLNAIERRAGKAKVISRRGHYNSQNEIDKTIKIAQDMGLPDLSAEELLTKIKEWMINQDKKAA